MDLHEDSCSAIPSRPALLRNGQHSLIALKSARKAIAGDSHHEQPGRMVNKDKDVCSAVLKLLEKARTHQSQPRERYPENSHSSCRPPGRSVQAGISWGPCALHRRAHPEEFAVDTNPKNGAHEVKVNAAGFFDGVGLHGLKIPHAGVIRYRWVHIVQIILAGLWSVLERIVGRRRFWTIRNDYKG